MRSWSIVHREVLLSMSWMMPARLAGSPPSRCRFSGRKKFQQDIGFMSGGAKWCG